MERIFSLGTTWPRRSRGLRQDLPHARDRKEVNALYDQIETLEAKGSTPARWEERDSGVTEGVYLEGASLAEQRTFLAELDIRAWHVGPEIFVTVDGKGR